ncbi:MAG TPA: diphthine synthase [Thermoplasmata archaeon]|nr:diphthine synthase [Thermoplasmata archaeon]
MSELGFVGAGLGDERDLSRRALDYLRSAGRVFLEEYTSRFPEGSIARLESEIQHPIERLDRAAVESGAGILAALGSVDRVALLTPGDPFAATTHLALRLQVESAGHGWKYLPAASALVAVAGYLGLIHYRFGRTVTLPIPEPGYDPSSPFERVLRNRSEGLHTLVLLDVQAERGRYLTADAALAAFDRFDPEHARLAAEVPFGVVARVGTEEGAAWWGDRRALATVDFGPPVHSLVLPAPDLHFQEEAAVRRFRVV